MRFSSGDRSHGEFSAEEMADFLAVARQNGWRDALDFYARPRNPRVVDLVQNPQRVRSLGALQAVDQCARVLDFGCGYGGISVLLRRFFECIGV